MSDQLTDETVAKALGRIENDWLELNGDLIHMVRHDWRDRLPKYTTSLDAIVGEINNRGRECFDWCWEYIDDNIGMSNWEPEDCCKALMAYLEEQ